MFSSNVVSFRSFKEPVAKWHVSIRNSVNENRNMTKVKFRPLKSDPQLTADAAGSASRAAGLVMIMADSSTRRTKKPQPTNKNVLPTSGMQTRRSAGFGIPNSPGWVCMFLGI